MSRGYEVEPAHLSQVMHGQDGSVTEISGDVGGVVAALRRLDPSLRVKVLDDARPPCFVVYQLIETATERKEHLVLTATATLNRSGVWEGLDHRIVRRVEQIMHPSYNFADELEKNALKRKTESRKGFRENVESHADRLLHAAQQDLGVKPRIFVP